jgi:hypothetical protein
MNDTNVDVNRPRCTNYSEPWFKGAWRDWHRGHACNLDDGKPRSQAAKQEFADHAKGQEEQS